MSHYRSGDLDSPGRGGVVNAVCGYNKLLDALHQAERTAIDQLVGCEPNFASSSAIPPLPPATARAGLRTAPPTPSFARIPAFDRGQVLRHVSRRRSRPSVRISRPPLHQIQRPPLHLLENHPHINSQDSRQEH